MYHPFRLLPLIAFLLVSELLTAQPFPTLTISLPDVEIVADQLVRGDHDVYGLGDWHCSFSFKLEKNVIKVYGEIVFSEKAHDFTTIRGTYYKELAIADADKYPACEMKLNVSEGTVSGPNVGARGHRWYKGSGVIRQAHIITDTFGMDTGKIGGTIQFEPLEIVLNCVYAAIPDAGGHYALSGN